MPKNKNKNKHQNLQYLPSFKQASQKQQTTLKGINEVFQMKDQFWQLIQNPKQLKQITHLFFQVKLTIYITSLDHFYKLKTNPQCVIKFFQLIKKCYSTRQLGMSYKIPLALHCLASGSFSYLKRLTLQTCQITTIEPLSYINAPHLQRLALGANFITSLQSLAKLKTFDLNKIILYQNLFNDSQVNKLTRSMFSRKSKCIKMLTFWSYNQEKFDYKFQNISAVVKLEADYFGKLTLDSKSRINQQKIQYCIKKKYRAGKINEKKDIKQIKIQIMP